MATETSHDVWKDPRLEQFLIPNVHLTGRAQLGTGAYGSVEEIEIRFAAGEAEGEGEREAAGKKEDEAKKGELRTGGLVCAGKRIHEALLEVENVGADNIVQKYVDECRLMARLRHRHLVKFLGLCLLPGSTLPLLVMEKLQTNLDDLLEHTPDIPLTLKRAILADIARGLVYLHGQNPAVIHRYYSSFLCVCGL